MSKIITVFGATGVQGGSVVKALSDNPNYTIRAVTRNANSAAATALAASGILVVEADLESVDSLKAAVQGSHAIFAVTNFFETLGTKGISASMERETRQGINLADAAAVTDTLEHYVWSTLPDSNKVTDGELMVPYFESKNLVDRYIKSIPHLLKKTTFLWLGWYARNITYPFYMPTPVAMIDGSTSYVQPLSVPASTRLPLLGDEKKNPGLFVQAILERPHKSLPGKVVSGAVEELTFSDVFDLFTSAQKIQGRCIEIVRGDYTRLWGVWSEVMDQAHRIYGWSGGAIFSQAEEVVLTKDDLGIAGLITTAEAFSKLPQMF